MQESWDILIILDACRYDFFEKVYRDYFSEGSLSKRISPGTWTPEWAKKVFTDVYNDVVYVSGNTYIRNRAASNSEIVESLRNTRPVDLFVSEEHFYRIIDVWKNRWDNGTVHPKDINEGALYARKKYSTKRLIIHYMQPHTPYTYALQRIGYNFRTKDVINRFITRRLIKFLGEEPALKIINSIGLPIIRSTIDLIMSKNGVDGLRLVYEENLRFVLEYIKNLIDYFKGRIVITEDHGELLWDNGGFGHGGKKNKYSQQRPKQLIEVPWFRVNRDKAVITIPVEISYTEPRSTEIEEKLIKERLKELGYI